MRKKTEYSGSGILSLCFTAGVFFDRFGPLLIATGVQEVPVFLENLKATQRMFSPDFTQTDR